MIVSSSCAVVLSQIRKRQVPPVIELKVGPSIDLDAILMACQTRSIGPSMIFINKRVGAVVHGRCGSSCSYYDEKKTRHVPLET